MFFYETRQIIAPSLTRQARTHTIRGRRRRLVFYGLLASEILHPSVSRAIRLGKARRFLFLVWQMKECWRASPIRCPIFWSLVKRGNKAKLSEKKEYECQSVFPSREMQAWGGDSLSLFSFLPPPHIYPSIHLRFLPVTSCCQTLRQGHQVRRRPNTHPSAGRKWTGIQRQYDV